MSPKVVFPVGQGPTNPICERIVEHPRVTVVLEQPRVTVERDQGALIGAIRDELIVRRSAREQSPRLDAELKAIARYCGNLGGGEDGAPGGDPGSAPAGDARSEVPPAGKPGAAEGEGDGGTAGTSGGPSDVEIWRLTADGPDDPDSIDVARRLRELAPELEVTTRNGPALRVPAVSPNHICVVATAPDWCPAGPPHPVPPLHPEVSGAFVEPPVDGPRAKVVVIDTGYIYTIPPHAELDRRVKSVPGHWYDTSATPPTWREDPPDELDADHDGRLDGVAGHGTFIAGIVAHHCRQAEITVVGQRHEVIPLGNLANPADQAKLFTTEFSLARSLLVHGDADVVSCGFAFPTLSMYPSIPFTPVIQFLTGPGAPRLGVAIVSPAGNESSTAQYWPAAHPDVVGVAATNRRGNARAWFSNWGDWVDCCARGEYVLSTFIHWLGPVEGEPLTDIERFCGWARWDGTSFATPKVSAAIAKLVASDGTLLPVEAWEALCAGTGGVYVSELTDASLSGPPGVALPHLHLG